MSETHVHGIDEANMERRTFLKGSMTAAALLGAAGMFGCAPNAAKQEGMKQEEAETADMPDTGAVDPTAEYECWLPPQGEVAFESEPVTDGRLGCGYRRHGGGWFGRRSLCVCKRA